MLNDPLRRLFAHNLTDESVDLLFTFLSQLTDLCFEAYVEQIVRMAQEANAMTELTNRYKTGLKRMNSG